MSPEFKPKPKHWLDIKSKHSDLDKFWEDAKLRSSRIAHNVDTYKRNSSLSHEAELKMIEELKKIGVRGKTLDGRTKEDIFKQTTDDHHTFLINEILKMPVEKRQEILKLIEAHTQRTNPNAPEQYRVDDSPGERTTADDYYNYNEKNQNEM